MKLASPRTAVAVLALLFACETQKVECASEDPNPGALDKAAAKMPKAPRSTKGEKILHTDKILRKSMGHLTSYAKKNIFENLKPKDLLKLSKKCALHLTEMTTALQNMKAWAFKMLDSWGKMPNGFLSGGIAALGDFDQCLDVNVTRKFQGKNCILEVYPPVPETEPLTGEVEVIPEMQNFTDPESLIPTLLDISKPHYDFLVIRTSLCLPSSCSENDIEFIAKKVMEVTELETEIHVTNCQVKESVKLEADDYIAIGFVAVMIFLVASGTVVDIIAKQSHTGNDCGQRPGVFVRTMLCFSVASNTKKRLKEDKSSDYFRIFYGMKVITAMWVLLQHVYVMIPFEIQTKLLFLRETEKNIGYQVVRHAYFNVDTFFFITGFLLMYGRMKQKTDKFSIPQHIIHRLWRLMPAVFGTMAVQRIIYRLGSGPLWHELFGSWVRNCKEKWWTNVLLFNNIYAFDGCVFWTWYIAVDVQIYILVLFLVVPVKRYPKATLAIFILMVTASIVGMVVNNVLYKIPAVISAESLFSRDDENYFLEHGYFASYHHTIVYLTGMAVGYVIYYRPKMQISSKTNVLCWIVFSVIGVSAVYSAYPWYNFVVPSLPAAAVYASAVKTAWGISLAWVTTSCLYGYGGFVTKLLSWSPFGPLSRLTYTFYLVHPLMIYAYASSRRTLIQNDHTTYAFLYLACVLASYCVAYVVSMVFEFPFIGLEKIVFGRNREPKAKSDGRRNENAVNNGDVATVTKL